MDYRDETPSAETHYSWLRSRMSAERTMMAYSRAAITFIGLGFTIYETFEFPQGIAGLPKVDPGTARWLGILLVGASIVVLAAGIWEYRDFLKDLYDRAYAHLATVRHLDLRTGTEIAVGLLLFTALAAFVALLYT
jgi:putative membrane protein